MKQQPSVGRGREILSEFPENSDEPNLFSALTANTYEFNITAGTVSRTLPRDISAEKIPVSNDVIEFPSGPVAVILRWKVSVSCGVTRPLAEVERMSVREEGVDEKRVGGKGRAGTPVKTQREILSRRITQ